MMDNLDYIDEQINLAILEQNALAYRREEMKIPEEITELYPGSVVRIYEDPITKEEPEGLAELIKRFGQTLGMD